MDIKDKLRILFYDRAPNSLIFEHIRYEFQDDNPDLLQEILDELVKQDFLEKKEYVNSLYPKMKRIGYRISSDHLGDYPIQTEIEAGNIKIPRMIDGDATRAEDINVLALSFNKIASEKIRELEKHFDSEMRKYWGTLATTFGLFLVIFSLVNVAIKPIYYAPELNLTAKQILFQSMFNIVPLGIVLLVFLFILYKLFRS